MASQARGWSTGQMRAWSLVPSLEVSDLWRNPASAAKVSQRSQDLECFALCLQQRGRVGTQAAKGVSPLRWASRSLRIEAMGGRIELDPLAIDLLDHRPAGEHLLQRVSGGQPAVPELEVAELRQRVVLVAKHYPDPVLSAQVAQEEGQHQNVGLVTASLQETGRGYVRPFSLANVAQVLHLEEAGRALTCHPGLVAAPSPGRRESFELALYPLQARVRQAVQSVMDDTRHD